jgi:hypothetical protein
MTSPRQIRRGGFRVNTSAAWPGEYALLAHVLKATPDLRQGNCVGRAPDWDATADADAARRGCASCVVRVECGDWLDDHNQKSNMPDGWVAGRKRDRGSKTKPTNATEGRS